MPRVCAWCAVTMAAVPADDRPTYGICESCSVQLGVELGSHAATVPRGNALIVVRRTEAALFRDLRALSGRLGRVTVILDRRHQNRRRARVTVGEERRRRERRRAPARTWEEDVWRAIGVRIVHPEGAADERVS